MKRYLPALKITALVLLLAGVTVGYFFFSTWQKNARPEVIETRWENSSVTLGHSAFLHVTLKAPWHRELLAKPPANTPSFLAPLPEGATLVRGRAGFTGKRRWQVTVPVVPTDNKTVEGLSLNLRLKPSNRPSSNSVTVPLPALEILIPGNLPKLVNNPLTFLTDETEKTETRSPVMTQEGLPWIFIIAIALALGAMVFFYLRNQTGRLPLLAWERALGDLTDLESSGLEPDAFFSRLTDILKSYTSERFNIQASAQTSSEFLRSVENLEEMAEVKAMDLPWLARLADEVKFAGADPQEKEPADALSLVRRFITQTKPKLEEDDA